MRAGIPLLALLAACGGSGSPIAISARAEANPYDVLAQRVEVQATGATTVHAEWTEDDVPRRSPDVPVAADGTATVDVLGLRPSTDYAVAVSADGAGGARGTTVVRFTTGSLPAALANLSLQVAGVPPDGLVVVNLLEVQSPGAVVAFDGRGVLRWYRLFEGPLSAQVVAPLAGGSMLVYVGSSNGFTFGPGGYVAELSPSGELLRSFVATAPFLTDPHEVLLTAEGTAAERVHLFGYQARTIDLSPLGIPGVGSIVGHVIQRLLPSGQVEFTWDAFDHLGLDELVDPPFPANPAAADFDHPNSLDLDPDGNYLVSFRNLDAVLLVDSRTGDVLWRLGGRRSDFTFVDDPLGGFSGQHCARFLPDGHLLLFDNGTFHDPPTSRAVEYELDPARHTARMVWEFRGATELYNAFTGSALRQPDGTTWVGFSLHGVIDQVSPDGKVLWEGRLLTGGTPTTFYRAVPIRSLYGETPP